MRGYFKPDSRRKVSLNGYVRVSWLFCGAFFFLCLIACSREKNLSAEQNHNNPGVLLIIGDSVLYEHRIAALIPTGLSEADSVQMFHALVNQWTEDMLIRRALKGRWLAMAEIEEKTNRYRNDLIRREYLHQMTMSSLSNIEEDSLRRIYESRYKGECATQESAKGIFVKLPLTSSHVEALRRLLSKASSVAVDNFEKYGLVESLAYDNFTGAWVAMHVIKNIMPPQLFAAEIPDTGRTYEYRDNEAIYFLRLTAKINPGDTLPYDYLRAKIIDDLSYENQSYDSKLLFERMYRKGLETGEVVNVGYDPLTHTRIDSLLSSVSIRQRDI